MKSIATKLFLIIIPTLFILPLISFAQSPWQTLSEQSSVQIEFLKPGIHNSFGNPKAEFFNGACFLTVRSRFPNGSYFVLDIPFGIGRYEDFSYYYTFSGGHSLYESKRSFTFGNIYLGYETGRAEEEYKGSFGIRLPIVQEINIDAAVMGIITDFDRAEAFGINCGFVFCKGMMNKIINEQFRLRTGLGIVFQVPVKEIKIDNIFTYLHYDLIVWYKTGRLAIGCGFSGLYHDSKTDGFNTLSVHQLGLTSELKIGKIKPTLYFRLPLDADYKQDINYIIGCGLTMLIP